MTFFQSRSGDKTVGQLMDDARSKFKKYVNVLALTKTEGDEKFLILRPKYANGLEGPQSPPPPHKPPVSTPPPSRYIDPINSLGIPLSPAASSSSFYDSSPGNSPSGPRQPPPYRPPPPVVGSPANSDAISITSSNFSANQDGGAPQVPPRRKSGDKLRGTSGGGGETLEEKKRAAAMVEERNSTASNQEGQEKQTVSVKERTQKFNRMASIEDELNATSPKQQQKEQKRKVDKGADEDDGAAVATLEPKKCTEWYVTMSKGNYQELVKLAKEAPSLVKKKDPFTAYTVLHWGAKHGNENIIKEFAGNYKADVNARTNGGYTPLHLAAQFGHQNVYDLLVQVYHADPDIRDFSGKTPRQYKKLEKQTGGKDGYRSEYNPASRPADHRDHHQQRQNSRKKAPLLNNNNNKHGKQTRNTIKKSRSFLRMTHYSSSSAATLSASSRKSRDDRHRAAISCNLDAEGAPVAHSHFSGTYHVACSDN